MQVAISQEDYKEQQRKYQINARRTLLSQNLSGPDVSRKNGYIMRDWRGQCYTVGTTVLYPRMMGQTVEMTEATVLDIWLVKRNDNYEWEPVNLADAALLPLGDQLEWRARLQPTATGSRYTRYDAVANSWKKADAEHPPKAVTLIKTENITAIYNSKSSSSVQHESPYDDWNPSE